MIGAEGAIAPATCFSGRPANGRLDPVLELSIVVSGVKMSKGCLCEGGRIDNSRAADVARIRRPQRTRLAFDARLVGKAFKLLHELTNSGGEFRKYFTACELPYFTPFAPGIAGTTR
jgi:hypothetical protein